MVTIKINMDALEMQMDGHANSDEWGKDLICCAISTLVETLSRHLEQQMTDGQLIDLHEEIEAGHVYIQAHPYGWSRKDIWIAFKVIREGLRAIAKENGKYIKLKEE